MAEAPLAVTCPACGRQHDQAMRVGGTEYHAPEVGDVSVCIRCSATAIWTPFGLRRPTEEEAAELAADPRIRQVQWAVQQANRQAGQ